jgi:hypothetical protein
VLDDEGNPVAPGEMGEVCVQRSCNGEMDPVFMLGYWNNPEATAEKFFGGGIDDPQAWGRTGDLAKLDEDGVLWYQGRSTTCSRAPATASARARSRTAWSSMRRCQRRRDRRAGRDARHRGQGLHRAAAGAGAVGGAGSLAAGPRAQVSGALRVSQDHRVHRRPADDHHRQGAAPAVARRGKQ